MDHVRVYNAAWNYYAGMSAAEIEAEIRHDTVWQRPTWPLGGRMGYRYDSNLKDHGLFGLEDELQPERTAPRTPLSPEDQALMVFALAPPVTLPGIKARYKELVKLHHPDANGGDKECEERLKIINQAYATLKTSYVI